MARKLQTGDKTDEEGEEDDDGEVGNFLKLTQHNSNIPAAIKVSPVASFLFIENFLYFVFNLCEGVILKGKVLRDFWRMKQGRGGDSLFVKLAAKLAWGDAHLAEHSVMGRKRSGEPSRPPLDKLRPDAVRGNNLLLL